MPGHNHGASIKNSDVYEALRRKGYSKTKAAKISNSKRSGKGGKGGKGKGGRGRR